MKKIFLLLIAIFVFTLPLQQNYIEVNAAIFSKAASKTAQKIAKEYIKDRAIMESAAMVGNTAKHIKNDPTRLHKEGFMLVCMDYTYKPGDKCAKPANVKANLTETDKMNIGKQAEVELDKKTGTTKWKKFLDWFVPIWLITFAVTAITYALDPDVKSLFDEVAYNTLVSLGLIAPVTNATPTPLDEVERNPDSEPLPEGEIPQVYISELQTKVWQGTDYRFAPFATTNMLYETQITAPEGTVIREYNVSNDNSNIFLLNFQNEFITISGKLGEIETVTLAVDGVSVETQTIPFGGDSTWGFNYEFQSLESIETKKARSIMSRTPYRVGDNYYTDVLWNTVDGKSYQMQVKTTENNLTAGANATMRVVPNTTTGMTQKHIVYRNKDPFRKILPPAYGEISEGMTGESSYSDENGNIALLPPVAFTYEEEGTGEQVERKQAPNGDGYVWQKPDGTEVPEENIIPREEEEPKITPSPDGTPQYTPAPTPSNPNPEPVPLQPEPTAPPVEPENPPTDPTIPDGQSCGKEWELPSFEPLEKTMSEAFPFSIPWDMQNALESAFGTIGNERPSFTLDMGFAGGSEWEITLPKFFDEWKPFTDTLLIFIFDIGIMFGIYRFMKGGSS